MAKVAALIRSALKSREGNFAVSFALAAPVLLGLAAGGMDMFLVHSQKSAIQNSVDAAALAAVREASLKGWDEKTAKAISEHVVKSNYLTHHASKNYYEVETEVDKTNKQVTVTVKQDHYPYFYSSFFSSPQIVRSATATAAGKTNICAIGLNPSASHTISLNDDALLTAPNCAVYSNSAAVDGMSSIKGASMVADLACSAGGFGGAARNYNKLPITDCPPMEDPLKLRTPPSYSSTTCKASALELKDDEVVHRLTPGVYCDGLTIKSGTQVILDPGIYVFKDGPLTLAANGTLFGRGIGIYFTGTGSTFSLASGSTVDLEAAKSGSMAGLIFFQDRSSAIGDFVLRSNNASNLLGTIYLPNGNFIIDTNSKVADASAYTAIVARSIQLQRKPNVVLNTNYESTDVPVPAGLGPSSGELRLLH